MLLSKANLRYELTKQLIMIPMSKIANLKIYYQREGEEVDATHKSWGTRLIEAIWPF